LRSCEGVNAVRIRFGFLKADCRKKAAAAAAAVALSGPPTNQFSISLFKK